MGTPPLFNMAAPALPKCKTCACCFSWTQFVFSIVAIAVAFYWTILSHTVLMCDMAAANARSYSLLGTSDLKIGGDMSDFDKFNAKVAAKLVDRDAALKLFQVDFAKAMKMAKANPAANVAKVSTSNKLLETCDKWKTYQQSLSDSSDPGTACLFETGCHPCEEMYKKETCSGDENYARAAALCHHNGCQASAGAYFNLFIVFIVLLVGNTLVGCATCTCCDTCGGNVKDGPAATGCLMGGCILASLLGLVGLILGYQGMTSKWVSLLRKYEAMTGQSFVNLLLIPCYLGLLSGILAESQAYPDYACYADSKANPNLVGGAAPAIGTVVQPAKSAGQSSGGL